MSLTLASWLFQHFDFGYITSLEPSTRPPKNAAAYITMENRVILGDDIAEDVRTPNVHERTQPYLTLLTTPRLYMLAAMSLNLWILLVIVRQKDLSLRSLLTFRMAGHIFGCWPVHHRICRRHGNCG